MKIVNQLVLWTLILFVALYYLKEKATNPFENSLGQPLTIIPHPQELSLKADSFDFVIDANTVIIIKDTSEARDKAPCEVLNLALEAKHISPLAVISAYDFAGSENAILIGELDNDYRLLDSLINAREMLLTPPYLRSEEYRLDVDPQFIVIVGKDKAATFFGVQTLIQLLKQCESPLQCKVSAVRITDFPDMALRSTYYGFHLKNLDDPGLIERGYKDIFKFSKYKFNMIGLDNHHYGHLEMEIPDSSGEKYWERFTKLFEYARKYHLRPRIGGWARWLDTDSPWGADPTTLEGIRTTQTMTMAGTAECTLRISTGHVAYNVLHNLKTGKSWKQEPIIVTDESAEVLFNEAVDYLVTFGALKAPFYDKVVFGEGEPAGYPLRRGESANSPTTIRRTGNSRIQDGQTVKVTFSYIGPDPWSTYKVRYCRSDPRVHTDGADNFIWRWCTQPVTYLNADIFNLEMDEIRVFAWDKRCLDSGKSRHQIFVDDVKYYYDTIRKKQPDALIMMWSDMIDPNHNAIKYKTEKAVDLFIDYGMTDIIMVPWSHKRAKASIEFLSDKGFSVMASSQKQLNELSVAPMWAKYLRDKFEDSDKPFGLMHAPWYYEYDTIEGLQRLGTAADYAWSVAPYVIHTPVRNVNQGESVMIQAMALGDRVVFDGESIRMGPLPIISANIYFRPSGTNTFLTIKMRKNNNQYIGLIPGKVIKSSGIEYYIEISDKNHTSLSPKSAPEIPYKIKVNRNPMH